jgi:hypothetical protein
MAIEPSFFGLALVVKLAASSHRHDDHDLSPGLLAERAADFVPAQLRQADIEDHDIGTKSSRFCEGLFAIVRGLNLISTHFQEHRECFSGITVVVHDQDFASGNGLFELRSHEIHIFLEEVNERQFVIVSLAKTFHKHFAQLDRSASPNGWLTPTLALERPVPFLNSQID